MKDDGTESYWWKATSADTSTDGVVVYTYPWGGRLRVEGNIPVRNQNPGAVRFSSDEKAREAGALTRDKRGFGVFPDWMTGKQAADDLWESFRKRKLTIRKLVTEYTETDQEQRISDLTKKAKGWLDRHGNPVNENTPVSDLSDEQFAILRNYNNIQLEGWIGHL